MEAGRNAGFHFFFRRGSLMDKKSSSIGTVEYHWKDEGERKVVLRRNEFHNQNAILCVSAGSIISMSRQMAMEVAAVLKEYGSSGELPKEAPEIPKVALKMWVDEILKYNFESSFLNLPPIGHQWFNPAAFLPKVEPPPTLSFPKHWAIRFRFGFKINTILPQAEVSSGGGFLEYVTSTLPSGLEFNKQSRELTGSPTEPGIYNFQYTAYHCSPNGVTSSIKTLIFLDVRDDKGDNTFAAYRIREARGRYGMTIPLLSERTSISEIDLHAMEEGRIVPTYPQVAWIAKVLNVRASYLRGRE